MNSLVFNVNALLIFNAQMTQVRDFIDLDVMSDDGTQSIDAISPQPRIEFDRISYRYSDETPFIFRDFSLTIESGEKLALVGINGAGKTTLMLLLMGLLEPTEGRILIDGRDHRSFSRKEYYRLFSTVFQDITVFPETIAANIAGSHHIDHNKLQKVIQLSGFGHFVETLEQKENTALVRDSASSAIDLSGGMNQRMLLARALYKDAPINILDEPTAALDPLAESRMYKEYDAMSRDKTSIFISHRLASTLFCDRIIYLGNGQILEEGTHHDLMNLRGEYYNMYIAQSAYYQEAVREAARKEVCDEI